VEDGPGLCHALEDMSRCAVVREPNNRDQTREPASYGLQRLMSRVLQSRQGFGPRFARQLGDGFPCRPESFDLHTARCD
jgi:hypothetical protein